MSQPAPVESQSMESLAAQVADDFMERLQRGEEPQIEEYARRYPQLATFLRQMLPALEVMRRLPPEGALAGGEAGSPTSACLGDFRILREVGRGGMGVVYEAEQVSLSRRVALKILPFAPALDPRQLQRFRNEAQAAAQLHHTNIVPVYAVGCERGVHYYAMQYIEGQTLAAMIDEMRGPSYSLPSPFGRGAGGEGSPRQAIAQTPVAAERGATATPAEEAQQTAPYVATPAPEVSAPPEADTTPQARLSTDRPARGRDFFRTVARLSVQAAEALEHAHQLGVLHRDIKPGNLMLDDCGQLWVTDFGLARVEADAKLTMTGEVIGTLCYMSPEQALGRPGVDHRTDVYSLGATLYELVTLEPAFAGANRQEVLRKIASEEPRGPRKFDRSIPAELETIALKAMAKEPQDRYATAQELADDLQRFLEDRPIRARRPTLAERVGKWSRRHKGLVASAASIAAIVLVATTVVTLIVAAHQRQDTRRQMTVERAIGDALAEAARLHVETQATPEGGDVGLALAREQLQRAVALADSGPADPDLVERVHQVAAELDQEHKDQQLLAALDRAWLARAETVVAASRFAPEATLPLIREALQAYGLAVGKAPPDEVAAAIRSKPEAVRRELLAALEEWQRLAPPRIGMALSNLGGKTIVASVVSDSPAGRDGRLKEGDRLVGVGLGREGPLVPTGKMTPPEVAKFLASESGTIVRLQVIPQGQSQPRVYEIQCDPTAAWLKAVVKAADDDPWRRRLREAFDLTEIAKRRAALLKLADEADVAKQPVRVLTRLVGELRNVGAFDREIGLLQQAWQKYPGDVWVNISLGLAMQRRSPAQLDEAARYTTAAIALRPDSAGAHLNLGIIFDDQKKPAAAAGEFREAIRLKPDYAVAHYNLGNAFRKQGKLEDAIAEYREAIRLDPKYAEAHVNLGSELGKLDEAMAEYREAIRLKPDLAEAHYGLGNALYSQGKPNEAIAEYREAIRLKPDDAVAHYILGNALYSQGKLNEAIAEFREAIRLDSDSAGRRNPEEVRRNLAAALEQQAVTAAWQSLEKAAVRWTPLDPSEFSSAGGATLVKLDDKSLLAKGLNPGNDTYVIRAESAAKRITAIRLDVLKHDSLPSHGPGRLPNGTFNLSGVHVWARPKNSTQPDRPVAFKDAAADYVQPGCSVLTLIDRGVGPGWQIAELPDVVTRDRSAVLELATPLEFPQGVHLTIALRNQSQWPEGNVGRFRLSVSSDPWPLPSSPAPARPPQPKVAPLTEGGLRRLTLVGKEMDLQGSRLDGTPLDWKAYRGKVVLVDFWTTWCSFCRPELANLRKNYRLYHDRGFEVVGVNLDEDRQKLDEFLRKDPVPWATLHADGAGWKHPVAQNYGISGVPTMFLVGKNGKVMSTQVRGQDLDELLQQALGPPYTPRGNLVCLDLLSKANDSIRTGRGGDDGHHLGELPRGKPILAGVPFQIGEGLIQLAGSHEPAMADEVTGIRVDRMFSRLYILHGTLWGHPDNVADGTVIGRYTIRYEDKSVETIPIVYGEDLRDFCDNGAPRAVTRAVVAWAGSNPYARLRGFGLQVYLRAWDNPHPEKKVTAIDLLSTKTACAPFCVAMTVEEPVAGPTKDPSHPAAKSAKGTP